jgi:drug/metabolite transporter (DMT)-like permease
MHTARLTACLYLTAAMAITGSYVALSKPLLLALPVFVLAGLRFGIAAIAMLPWTAAHPTDAPLAREEKRLLFLESLFGNFLFSLCMLTGMSMTSASAAGVIFATIPAVVAVLSWLVLKEKLEARSLAAIVLSVSGLVVLQFAKQEGGAPEGAPGAAHSGAVTQSLIGNALIFCAVVCEAIYVVLGRRLLATIRPKRVSALINLIGFALMLPFALWQGVGFAAAGGFAQVSLTAWALLLYYALAASVFSAILWLKGLQTIPANQAGVFTLALPLSATLIGVLGFGERFSALHGLAFALAIGGLILIVTGQTAAPSQTPNR